jgi:hypothetical protein
MRPRLAREHKNLYVISEFSVESDTVTCWSVREHQTPSLSLFLAFFTKIMASNSSQSQLNLLFCSGCHCPRSIFQFPLKNGWRTATCASCLERQALSYTQRIQEREAQEDKALGPPRRCSSCAQLREPSLFGRFLTCEPCRRRNTKSQRRRMRARDLNPPPTRAELEDHLQRRQRAMGKQEQGWAGYRAITIEDYTRSITQEEEQELQDRQQRRAEGRGARRAEYERWREQWRENWV